MNRTLLATFIGIAATSPLVVQQQVLAQPSNPYQQARPSVVLIQSGTTRRGTGFIVSGENGTYYVLTAKHVLQTNDPLELVTHSNERIRVETKLFIPDLDLALVQFSSNNRYNPLRPVNNINGLVLGLTRIFILGYPANESGDPAIPGGNITSRSTSPSGASLSIFHNVETKAGMSGSPVLTENGEVIGVHVGLPNAPSFREAIPIEEYLRRVPNIFIQSGRDNLAAGRFDQAIASIQQGRGIASQDTPGASIILAYAHFGKENLGEAREQANKVIKNDSSNAEAFLLLGAIDYVEGKFDSAIRNATAASTLDSRNLGGYAFAILSLSQAQNPSSIVQANINASNASNFLPNDPVVYLARSCAQIKSNNVDSARALLDSANRTREQRPNSPSLAVLSARLQQSAIECIPPELRRPRNEISPPPPNTRYKSREPISLEDGATAISVSRDSRFAAVGLRNGNMTIYDLQNRAPVTSFNVGQNQSIIGSVAFSPNGRDIAVGANNGDVRVFNIRNGSEKYRLNVGGNPVLVFSNNNELLYIGSSTGTLRMVNNQSGETLIADANAHPNGIRSLILSPDGRFMASGGTDGVIRLWSTSNLSPLDSYPTQQGEISSMVFSNDGSQIVSADFDVVKSCNWQNKQCTDVARSRQVIRGLAVANNGHLAYSADNEIFLEDQRNKQSLGKLSGHSDQVDALAYTPDGRFLISGSNDKTLIIWEVQ